jgi:N-formylglutamate amidohydrolase
MLDLRRCHLWRLSFPRVVSWCLAHSGRYYPPEMLAITRLEPLSLRRSEDAFVDLLLADAPDQGADLIINQFARAFVDVNRCETEIDPWLVGDGKGELPRQISDRVKAGLGVIPRTVGDNIAIYNGRLSALQAFARLDEVYQPWHSVLEARMTAARLRAGNALLLDCHSMPSDASGDPTVDIVLGDRFGASCAPAFTAAALTCLRESGFRVGRNDPYAGGYSTMRHSRILEGNHALQIEINRSLYMVEGAFTQRVNFGLVKAAMATLVACLGQVSLSLAGSGRQSA